MNLSYTFPILGTTGTYIKEIHGHVNIDMYALFEAVYQKYKNISE